MMINHSDVQQDVVSMSNVDNLLKSEEWSILPTPSRPLSPLFFPSKHVY